MNEEQYKICPACGEKILASAKKCKHCKTWLTEESNVLPKNRQRHGKFGTLLTVAIVALAIANAIVGTLYVRKATKPNYTAMQKDSLTTDELLSIAKCETKLDSFSYAIGSLQANGLKKYLAETYNVDSTKMDKVLYGLVNIALDNDTIHNKAYLAGVDVSLNIYNNSIMPTPLWPLPEDGDSVTVGVNKSMFAHGLLDGCSGNFDIMSYENSKIIEEQNSIGK